LRNRQAIQRGHQRLKLPHRSREVIAEQRGHDIGRCRSVVERRRQLAEPALHCVYLRAVDLLRHQQRASRRIGDALDSRRALRRFH
jgi:hypothetical protein